MRLEIDTTVSAPSLTEKTETASGIDSAEVKSVLNQGIKAAQAGNRAQARASLLRATELDMLNESAWLWLASISEYPEELLGFLNHVLAINPENQRALEWKSATHGLLSKTFVQRGIDASQENNTDFATECFRTALEYNERNADAWMWMASISDSSTVKIALLEKSLAINPENESASAELEIARASILKERLAEAKSAAIAGDHVIANNVLDGLLAVNPNSIEAWTMKSHLTDNFDEKIRCFESILAIDPSNIAAMAGRDSLLSLFGTVEAAPVESVLDPEPATSFVEHVEESIEISPTQDLEAPESVDHELASPQTETEYVPEEYHDHEQLEAVAEPFASLAEETPEPIEAAAVPAEQSYEYDGRAEAIEESYSFQVENVSQQPYAYDGVTEPVDEAPSMHVENVAEEPYVYEAVIESVDEAPSMHVETVTDQAYVYEQPSDEAHSMHAENVAEQSYEHAAVEEIHSMHAENVAEQSYEHAAVTEPVEETHSMHAENVAEQSYEHAAVTEPVEETHEMHFENVSDEAYGDATIFSAAPEQQIDDQMPAIDEAPEAETHDAWSAIEMPSDALPEIEKPTVVTFVERPEVIAVRPESFDCPFCHHTNDAQTIACDGCRSVLTLSDLEMLLANQNSDKAILRSAVDEMERRRQTQDLTPDELITLGLGHINLRNLQMGYSCLLEASKQCPNNVVLGGQVNALLIRLDEIKKQEEAHLKMPKGKSILVVDDSPTVRKLIAGKLEKSGHEVVCANDGVEAMERLENFVPDLILLDIAMPRMDGYQVCKQIRSNVATKDVTVVMISGKDGFFDKVRGRMAGTTGYITKPFGPETLMKAVEMYLSGEAPDLDAV